MRVIHLMSTNDYSGAENVVFNIIKGTENKVDVYYATQRGKITEFLDNWNIKNVIYINKLSISEIKRIEREYKPDIIHAHDYKATVMASIAVKNTKVISHLHNNSPWIKNIFHPYTWALLVASLRISKILTVSEAIKKEYVFSKLISSKIENVSNPVSIKSIQEKAGTNNEKLYDICFVGRLTEQKNPLRFINIIKQVKQNISNVRVIILGDGELKEICKQTINKLELTDNIQLLGFKKNPYKYMAKSKVFCLTSKWEGFGLVAFEALSLGVPTIVSNVGGLVDIVNEQCGKICKSDEEFLKEIIDILKYENVYKEKSKNAIQRANQLDNYKQYMERIIYTYKK